MNSKIQIMDVTNKTFLFRNRDDIFLIGDIDIGYPVQLDFKLSTSGKRSKWRFNTARVSVCRCKETQYDDWDNSLDFTGKSSVNCRKRAILRLFTVLVVLKVLIKAQSGVRLRRSKVGPLTPW